MDSVKTILNFSNTSVLFLAPPAWGKTRMILNLYEGFEGRIYYISPLKALSEEFKSNFSSSELYDGISDFKIYIGTAENFLFHVNSFEIHENDLLIIDEVHLFYLWDSFRGKLLEFRNEVFSRFSKCLLLSATMDQVLIEKLSNDVNHLYENNYLIDLGNLKLKNKPLNYFLFPKSLFLQELIIFSSIKIGRVILFVKYREQVKYYLEWAKENNIEAVGCVGGEAFEFSKKDKDSADLFVSTTVLSHGVNLPAISTVLINYQVEDIKFFLQMISRAGRRGENFNVYCQDKDLKDLKKLKMMDYGSMFFKCMKKYLY